VKYPRQSRKGYGQGIKDVFCAEGLRRILDGQMLILSLGAMGDWALKKTYLPYALNAITDMTTENIGIL
jgi:hypothetical protein